MSFELKETVSLLLMIFAVIALGNLLGRIRIHGVALGTAGIFLVGLLFGHFGVSIPACIQSMGIAMFMAAVGLSAGPGFPERIRRNGLSYLALCLCVAASGALVCKAIGTAAGMDKPLAVGIMTGAFTTSPGFAAAMDAVAADAEAVVQVAAGYGIAYPVGVVCKVLYIQVLPKLLHADMAKERELIRLDKTGSENTDGKHLLRIDKLGVFPLALAICGGLLLGSVRIAIPGGTFSLGSTGGPLLFGLILGCLGHLGPVDMKLSPNLTASCKEIGVSLFFVGAGTEGGKGIVAVLQQYGASAVLGAFLCALIPLTIGYLLFRYVFKLPLLNGLGAMSASMTCTPSLAMLIQVAGTDDVAAAYATTYPIALIVLVLVVQLLL